jgi:hypothetical protein
MKVEHKTDRIEETNMEQMKVGRGKKWEEAGKKRKLEIKEEIMNESRKVRNRTEDNRFPMTGPNTDSNSIVNL